MQGHNRGSVGVIKAEQPRERASGQKGSPPAKVARRAGSIGTIMMMVTLVSCSNNGPPGGGKHTGGGDGSYIYLSGNWEVQTSPTSSPTPFTSLAGFINEQGQNPGVDDLTTVAFQATPGSCYEDATVIPLKGSTQGANLHVESFSVNGQVLTIKAKKDVTATHLNGTYSISGGCANGATGTISGTEYANMTGTYAGSINGSSPTETLSLNLSQYVQGSGNGAFLVSGKGAFSGISCFSTAALASQNGAVVGSSVSLLFNTNDPRGAQLQLTGSIDPSANTFTLSEIQVIGGSCPGSLGTATLTVLN
jgi:hypothetical protein